MFSMEVAKLVKSYNFKWQLSHSTLKAARKRSTGSNAWSWCVSVENGATGKKRENQLTWKEKQKASFDQVVVSESSDSTGSGSDSEVEGAVGGVIHAPQTNKRGRINILTPSVLSSLDRAKISDRHAVQLIAPIIHASGANLEEYSINRSSSNVGCRA